MARTREIKKRMNAVTTIQRITKTMQMIATAKFTAALHRAQATRPYSEKVRRLVAELSSGKGGGKGGRSDIEHPLLSGPTEPVKRELILVITSDRGLCGAYNGNVLRHALKHLRRLPRFNSSATLHTSGKKAVGYFKFQRIAIDERFTFGDKPSFDDVEQLADRYIAAFAEGQYDAVRVAYMRFVSNSRQVPDLMQILPLEPEAVAGAAEGDGGTGGLAGYEFSPSKVGLLDALLPMAVKSSLFQAFNDAAVSEQIMRMVAMKAATDNAKSLAQLLRRQFNRARQTQITTELMEVISGSAALE